MVAGCGYNRPDALSALIVFADAVVDPAFDIHMGALR